MKKVQLVVFLLCLLNVVNGQVFSGIVKNANGKKVRGVKVELVEENKSTITDKKGRWSIETLDTKSKTIVFSKEGFTYEQIINQKPNKNLSISLRNAVLSLASVREQQYVLQGCNTVVVPDSPEWNATFVQSELKGDLAPNRDYVRRDPSAVIFVNGLYYMWYSFSLTETRITSYNVCYTKLLRLFGMPF